MEGLSREPVVVLLDLDGTLIDSAPDLMAAAADALRVLGLPVPDARGLRSFVGPPIAESLLSHGVTAASLSEAVTAFRAAQASQGTLRTTVYPGVPEALAALRKDGAHLAIATSKPLVYAAPLCDNLGLSPLVDVVCGAPPDGQTATKAEIIAAALGRFTEASQKLPRQAVMVGDRHHDVTGARWHHIPFIGARWGYAEPGELEAAGAVMFADDPLELPSLTAAAVEVGRRNVNSRCAT